MKQNVEKLVLITTVAMDRQISSESDYNSLMEEIAPDWDLNSFIPLGGGFIHLKDFLLNSTHVLNYNQQLIDVGEVDIEEPVVEPPYSFSCSVSIGSFTDDFNKLDTDEYSKVLTITDANSTYLKDISVTEALVDVQNLLHSATTLLAAVTSFDATEIADRITIFRDTVGSTFTDVFDDTSNTASYYTDLLRSSSSLKDFLATLKGVTQITELADNEIRDYTATEMYQVTGATPVAVFSLTQTIVDVTDFITETAYTAVKSLIDFVVPGLIKKADKVVKNVRQIVKDPYDIENINSNGNHTVHRWTTVGNGYVPCNQEELPIYVETLLDLDKLSDVHGVIKFDTVLCELLLTDVSVTHHHGEPETTVSTVNSFSYAYKIKPLNPIVFRSMLNKVIDDDGINLSSVEALTEVFNLLRQCPDMHVDTDSPEDLLYAGFFFSKFLMMYMTTLARAYNNNLLHPCDNYFITWVNKCIPKVTGSLIPASVSNLDFAILFSEYAPLVDIMGEPHAYTTVADYWTDEYPEVFFDERVEIGSFPNLMLWAFLQNRLEARAYPISFGFLPFITSEDSFLNSSFILKTDDENNAALKRMISTVLIIIASVAAAIYFIPKVKRIMNDTNMKAVGATRAYENALVKGKATPQMYKEMKKLRLKSKILGVLTNGTRSKANGLMISASNTTDEIITILK
jgi:hypothetical protein